MTITNTYKLYFDGACPVCNSFVSLIRSKVDESRISFIPISTNDSNFKFETSDGTIYFGDEAINQLATAFPSVLNYFWMLPKAFQKPALHLAYKVGGAIRNVIKKDCGCNKK